ncbi:beta strand repeat-containing protein, partial [Flavobacterium sp. RSB2_4_14]|uniref:beta strand repeat-containing protein n=1 Tax=Flavobacterium sp. RSB2_4_14 TaxID=3447665 RepID=UPI003F40D57A
MFKNYNSSVLGRDAQLGNEKTSGVGLPSAQWFFGIFLLFGMLFTGFRGGAQCTQTGGPYQVFESFSASLPTQGGTWASTSLTFGTTATTIRTGSHYAIFNAVGDVIRTPSIVNPGVFSFWYSRSSTSTGTPQFTIETSPDNIAWTGRGTVSTFTTTYQKFTLDIGALGLTNVFVRVRDTRASGTAERYIEDMSWTSTSGANNTIINNLGAGTVVVSSLPYSATAQTTCGNGNNVTSLNASVVCGSSSYYLAEDKTYVFTPTSTGVHTILITTSTDDDAGIMLYQGCPLSGGTCVANAQGTAGLTRTLSQNLTSGVTYYLVVDNFTAPACINSFNINIDPPPIQPIVSSFTPNANLCINGGQTVTITGANFTGTTAVTFNGVNAASFSVVNSTTITAVTPATLGAGIITVTNPAGSANSAAYTVVANPSVGVSPTTATFCTGGTPVTLTASGASTYTWVGTGTPVLSAAVGTSVTASPTTATTITVTGTDGNGCTNTATAVVTPSATPSAPTTTPYSVCVAGTVPGGQGLVSSASTLTGSQTVNFTVSAQPIETNAAPGNIVASATMAALPAGATVTSITLSYPNLTALSSSYRSDINLGLSGAIVNTAAAGTGAPSFSGSFNYTRTTTTGITSTNIGGAVNLLYWDSLDDNFGLPEATFPTGTNVATLTINFSYPATINWYTASTGGTSIGSGTPFNPVGVANSGLADTNTAGTFTYFAEASNNGSCPSARTSALFTVSSGAAITADPSSIARCVGQTATFTVTATGVGLTYQWTKNGVDIPIGGNASAGTNSLSLTNVTLADADTYAVRVSSTCGSPVTSAGAVLTVNALPAVTTASGAGTFCTSATISATNGSDGTMYFQGTTSGGTSTATASASQVVSASGTYYFRAQSAAGCWGTEGSVVVTIQAPVTITTTAASICAGGTGTLTASATCSGFVNSGTSITGSWSGSSPTANRITTSMDNSTTCGFSTTVRRYTATQFQVSVTGAYVFEMNDNSAYDGMGYITTGAFTPGSCATGTWVRGDDDGGINDEPILGSSSGSGSMTLTAGVTYTLYSGVFANVGASYTWTITPPSGGQIMLPVSGTLEWYTSASGGSSIGSGSPFNPVGVAGSGLVDTTTPGTTTYYVACSLSSTCRTPVNFEIKAKPTLTSGSAITPACGVTTADITAGVTSNGSVSYFGDAGYLTSVPTPTAVTVAQTYYIRASLNGCTTDGSRVVNAFKANPTTSSITGSGSVCSGSTSAYSVTDTAGSSYAWTITGGTQASGGTTSSITVTWGAAGSGSVSVVETNVATCVGTAVNLSVTVNPNSTPTVTLTSSDGDNTFAYGTPVTFTATEANIAGGTVSYDFRVNGTSIQNGVSNTYAVSNLANGNQVSVVITVTGGTCLTTSTATSNTITNTVTGAFLTSITNYCGQTLPFINSGIGCSVPSGVVGTLGYRFKV